MKQQVLTVVLVLTQLLLGSDVGAQNTENNHDGLFPAGWHVYNAPGKHGVLSCAAVESSQNRWTVTLSAEKTVTVEKRKRESLRAVSLPAGVSKAAGMSGVESVLSVDGGTLLAFDAGEFVGGLWFLPESSLEPVRLLRENVVALLATPDGPVVVTGIEHGPTNRGSAYLLAVEAPRTYTPQLIARFNDAPELAVRDGTSIIVITGKSVVRVDAAGRIQRLGDIPEHLQPNSIVIDSGGKIYVGMNLAVARLIPSSGEYMSAVLLPDACSLTEEVEANGEDYCRCDINAGP